MSSAKKTAGKARDVCRATPGRTTPDIIDALIERLWGLGHCAGAWRARAQFCKLHQNPQFARQAS